jgi:hypothetical protein
MPSMKRRGCVGFWVPGLQCRWGCMQINCGNSLTRPLLVLVQVQDRGGCPSGVPAACNFKYSNLGLDRPHLSMTRCMPVHLGGASRSPAHVDNPAAAGWLAGQAKGDATVGYVPVHGLQCMHPSCSWTAGHAGTVSCPVFCYCWMCMAVVLNCS